MTGVETLNDMYTYNVLTEIWTKIDFENGPSPRTESCGIVYRRKFYIFGGKISNQHLTNEI